MGLVGAARQASVKAGRGTPPAVRAGSRASCFHSAATLSTIVATAAPWIAWINRIWLNSASSAPKAAALTTMPNRSATESSATTRGCAEGGARSVASASPTVCTVWSPAPTSRKASAAAACPTQAGPCVSPDSRMSAKGMMDRPPSCSSVPIQR